MATTTPFAFRDFIAPATVTTPGIGTIVCKVGALIDEYESALGDSDKASDTDDCAYHEGRAAALESALSTLLDVPQSAWDTYNHG